MRLMAFVKTVDGLEVGYGMVGQAMKADGMWWVGLKGLLRVVVYFDQFSVSVLVKFPSSSKNSQRTSSSPSMMFPLFSN